MPTNFPASLDAFDAVPESQAAATVHRERHQNIEDAVEALEASVGVTGSGVATSLRYLVDQISGPDGAGVTGYTQGGTGSEDRTVQAKLREWVSVTDFAGVTGDGLASDQTGFNSALALGVPVFVPYTANYYVLATLTDANRGLLWGPGRVKVAGVDVNISSEPRSFGNALASRAAIKPTWQPAQYPGVQGSIGNGSVDDDMTRTGGFGTYGMDLKRLHVTAAVPAGQFDVVGTAWITATNLTGGQTFAAWHGANTPARYLSGVYSGGAVIGHEVNVGNRWADFGLQTDVGGTRYTVGQQIAPDVLPAKDGDNLTAVSGITIASPGVATVTAHGFIAGMGFVLTGSGTVPTGLVKDTTYYVIAAGLTTDTFRFAASPGGTAINTTGTFVGPISIRPSWAGSFGTVYGASVHGHRWWVGTLIRANTIVPAGYGHYASGGAVADQAPAAWTKLVGFWTRGLDMRGCVFSSYAIDLDTASYLDAINFAFSSVVTSATAGGFTLPANPAGFVKFAINGNTKVFPYYNL
jgi:hypothetical protein